MTGNPEHIRLPSPPLNQQQAWALFARLRSSLLAEQVTPMKAIDLRPGYGFKMDGKVFVITGFEHRTPGNLRAFVQLKYRNVQTGQILEKRFNPSEDVDVIDLDRRNMEYLFSDSTGATFMDTE